ncbi:MAG: DUF2095 family protein [Candidatus Lokiarchaeota archaeon]|nr:DUF2095 family protein [Candidatus Lokiarchaeota archaeon]
MEKEDKNKKSNKKIKIEDKEGFLVSYDRKELDEIFPHLIKEVFEKKKSIKIDSFNNEIEQKYEEKLQGSNDLYPNELYNPGAVDFIRRCTTKEEVIKILDYLLKKNEISMEDYNNYRNIISQEDGLDRLINESGGFKRPGYYMRKYYKENPKNQKLNTNDD